MARVQQGFNGFPQEAFEFFEQLARHNNRDWFHAHQALERLRNAIDSEASGRPLQRIQRVGSSLYASAGSRDPIAPLR